jgi:integrase
MAAMSQRAIKLGFTEKKVRELPIPYRGQRAIYVDTEPTRLRLRVTPTAKTWFVQYRPTVSSGSVRYSLGTFPDMSVDRARKQAQKIIGKVAASEQPDEARRALRNELTFGELASFYFDDRIRAKKRTVAALRQQYERWLGRMPNLPAKKHSVVRIKPPEAVDWSRRRLSEVDRATVAALHRRISEAASRFVPGDPSKGEMRGRHTGGETLANRVIEQIRTIFELGVVNHHVRENPATNITKNPEKTRSRFLEGHELSVFQRAVDAEAQPWRDFFTVALYVGYRRRALQAMAWSDVNTEAGTWCVPGEVAKNGEPIVLPITGPALVAIKARGEKRLSKRWVFPGESAAGHIGDPRKAWNRICERAGFENVRIHDLRRTLGSWMAMSGLSLPAIGRALGHKDPRSTEVYAHLQADVVRTAVDLAHEAMAQAAKNSNVVALPKSPISANRGAGHQAKRAKVGAT